MQFLVPHDDTWIRSDIRPFDTHLANSRWYIANVTTRDSYVIACKTGTPTLVTLNVLGRILSADRLHPSLITVIALQLIPEANEYTNIEAPCILAM